MSRWLQTHRPNKLPNYASHQVGVCGELVVEELVCMCVCVCVCVSVCVLVVEMWMCTCNELKMIHSTTSYHFTLFMYF